MTKFTYEKRLGMVNVNKQVKEGGLPGIKINGKYWCTKGGIIFVVPDQWADKNLSSSFPYEKLPEEVTEAIGADDEIVKL